MGRKILWTNETLGAEALKYGTRKEFQKAKAGAYRSAYDRGILDTICAHMSYINKPWTDKQLRIEAAKYTYKVDFIKHSSGAYQSARKKGILEDICKHMKPLRIVYTLEYMIEVATPYTTRGEFSQQERNTYAAAFRAGVLEVVCEHMEPVPVKWTHANVVEEALNHRTRDNFRLASGGAYNYALLHDITEAFTHMEDGVNKSTNDILYFYNSKEYPSVYKIGVTSKHLGTRRVHQVLREGGLTLGNTLKLYEVDNAFRLEIALHKIFKLNNFPFPVPFSGSTEFYTLTPKDIRKVKNMIKLEEVK